MHDQSDYCRFQVVMKGSERVELQGVFARASQLHAHLAPPLPPSMTRLVRDDK